MSEAQSIPAGNGIVAVPKTLLLNGKAVRRHSVVINGQRFLIGGGPLKFAALEEELFEDLKDPEVALAGLAKCRPRPDIFTFCQRIPETEPKYGYQSVTESLAVLPISTYEEWWTNQQSRSSRNKVRKSQKAGVELREATLDDEFVRGMVEIFNEAPVRQGRRFWHYGKDFETVKREFSTFLFREYLIGAYLGNELIGFVMLANAGRFGILGQFISKMEHRDKATNNALIAKTVEVCALKGLRHLLYTDWRETSLVDFKKGCGFEETKLPRYSVPVTVRGRIALQLKLYEDWRRFIPSPMLSKLKKFRRYWFELRSR